MSMNTKDYKTKTMVVGATSLAAITIGLSD